MNKLKAFARTYFRSISEPKYYNDIIKAKFSFSLKYFFLFYVILNILSVGLFSVRYLPQLYNRSQKILHATLNYYPADLTLTYQQQTLSVDNYPTPINVPFVNDTFERDYISNFDSFVIIDPDNVSSDTAVLRLTDDSLDINFPDTQPQRFTYQELAVLENTYQIPDPLVVDKQFIDTEVPMILDVLPVTFAMIAVWMLIFSLIFWPLLMFAFALFLSSLSYLASRLGNQELKYTQIVQINLHALTFAETAAFLQRLAFYQFDVPNIFAWAFIGAVFMALWSLEKE